jgi:hypothetical protein
VAAAPVTLIEFSRLLVFNDLIANGDAHLKKILLNGNRVRRLCATWVGKQRTILEPFLLRDLARIM